MLKCLLSATKFFLIAITFISITACAVRIDQPLAPLQQQEIVKQFILDENTSRVHVINSYGTAIDIYINDKIVGMLGVANEFMAIDLMPGDYVLTWKSKSPGDGILTTVPFKLSVSNNDLVFVRAKFGNATPALAEKLGAIGLAVGMKFIAYFEQENSLKTDINKYKLVLQKKL